VQYLENNVPKKVCTTHNYAQVNDSCGFNNRGPDWGTQLDTSDNPTLDIDDVDGFGPETISMKNPPKDQNKYRVMVRLYADPNQPTSGKKITKDNPVKAFVSIYLNKEACQSKAVWQPFQMTLQHWKVADITWKGDATTCDDINILPLNPPVPVPMTDLNYLTEALNVQCLDIQNPACEYANPFKAVPAGLFDPCSTTQPRSIWCDAPGTPDCCYKTNTCTCCP
jgi:hypothetical protein